MTHGRSTPEVLVVDGFGLPGGVVHFRQVTEVLGSRVVLWGSIFLFCHYQASTNLAFLLCVFPRIYHGKMQKKERVPMISSWFECVKHVHMQKRLRICPPKGQSFMSFSIT